MYSVLSVCSIDNKGVCFRIYFIYQPRLSSPKSRLVWANSKIWGQEVRRKAVKNGISELQMNGLLRSRVVYRDPKMATYHFHRDSGKAFGQYEHTSTRTISPTKIWRSGKEGSSELEYHLLWKPSQHSGLPGYDCSERMQAK